MNSTIAAERPLRIAVFADVFPSVSETFVLRHITGLLELGHEVDIYAQLGPPDGTPLHPEVAKYDLLSRTTYVDVPLASGYWEVPVWPLADDTWLPGSEIPIPNEQRALEAVPYLIRCLSMVPRLTLQVLDPALYSYQAHSLSALYRLAALSSRPGKYDVLHAHFGPIGNSFKFARELWSAPYVVTFHGYDFCTFPRKHGQQIYEHLFTISDLVTVNSNYTMGRVENLGCPEAKLHKLPVGVDPEEFSFSVRTCSVGEPVRILTVARLVEIKGVEFAIRAFARVRDSYPHVSFDIVGDGPLKSRLEGIIRQLGVEDTVTLHGALDGVAVRQMMSEAHLFMLTSVNVEGDEEGQGLVLQEAQASGLPVVATNHGGFPESILSGASGLLVPERDVESLSRSLVHLIEHPDLWGAMGRAGRAHVEANFDIRNLNLQLVDLYRGLIRLYQDQSGGC